MITSSQGVCEKRHVNIKDDDVITYNFNSKFKCFEDKSLIFYYFVIYFIEVIFLDSYIPNNLYHPVGLLHT